MNQKYYSKIITLLLLVIITIIGCSSPKYVIRDYRYEITNAETWTPEYILNNSTSGIKLEFITKYKKSDNHYWEPVQKNWNKLEYINLKLWKYPLDTVVKVNIINNYRESLPSNRLINLKTINYKIKNKPIILSTKIDSNKTPYFNVPPGKYFLSFSSLPYIGRMMRKIIIKSKNWSVVKIDTVRYSIKEY